MLPSSFPKCPNLDVHQQYMKVPDAPCSCYYSYFLAVCVRHIDGCVLVSHVASIYIFLMINVGAKLSYVSGHLAIFWEEFVQVFFFFF